MIFKINFKNIITYLFLFVIFSIQLSHAQESKSEQFSPGTIIYQMDQFSGYTAQLHDHPSEGLAPCIILTSQTDEIHLLIDKKDYDWIVNSVIIKKGNFSPFDSLKIGGTLTDLKKIFPNSKMMRVQSEITDPVVFRVNDICDFTVEWEKSFYEQGGTWEGFNPGIVPDKSKILEIYWYGSKNKTSERVKQ